MRLISAKKRRSVHSIATTPYRQEMVRLLGEPGDEGSHWAYRQRWKAKTVISVASSLALTARIEINQRVQALLRGVADTIHRLVRLGSSP